MKEYRPVDSVYEDIYDFDDVKYDTQLGIIRPRELYSSDRTHHLKSFSHGDDTANLPSIPGSHVIEKIPRVKPILHRGGDEMIKNKVVNLDVEKKPYIPTQTKKVPEYAIKEKSSRLLPSIEAIHENREQRARQEMEDEVYRSLMAEFKDKTLLDASPQVIEYERRNKVKRLLSRPQMPKPMESKLHPAADETTTQEAQDTHDDALHLPDIHQKSAQHHGKPVVHQPLPPKAPKPENEAFSRKKRKNHRIKAQNDNQEMVQHIPISDIARAEVDHEKKVNEAINQHRRQLQNEAVNKRKPSLVCDNKVVKCKAPGAASNSSLSRCSTPNQASTVTDPCSSVEPDQSWNVPLARRKLGYIINTNEKEKPAKIDVGKMPEKIKKKMKKYF